MESWKLVLIGLGVFFVLSVNIITVYFLYYYKKKRRSSATAVEIDIHKSRTRIDTNGTESINGLNERIDLEKQMKPSLKSSKPPQRQAKTVLTTHATDSTQHEVVQEPEVSSAAASAPTTPTPSMKIQHQKELYGGSHPLKEHLQHSQILLQHHQEQYHQLSTSLSPPKSNIKPTTNANPTTNKEKIVSPLLVTPNPSASLHQPLQQKLRVFSLSPDNTNISETIAVASPNHSLEDQEAGERIDEQVKEVNSYSRTATDQQSVYSDYRQSRAMSSDSASPYHALEHFIAHHAATPPPRPTSSPANATTTTDIDAVDVVLDWRGPTPPWTQYPTPRPRPLSSATTTITTAAVN